MRISDWSSDVCSSDLGDILNLDVTVIKDGWHGDTSRMYYAGEPSVMARRLVDATYEAMWRGIRAVKPGATLGDVGDAIEQYDEGERFSAVREYCGTGSGKISIGRASCRERGGQLG